MDIPLIWYCTCLVLIIALSKKSDIPLKSIQYYITILIVFNNIILLSICIVSPDWSWFLNDAQSWIGKVHNPMVNLEEENHTLGPGWISYFNSVEQVVECYQDTHSRFMILLPSLNWWTAPLRTTARERCWMSGSARPGIVFSAHVTCKYVAPF